MPILGADMEAGTLVQWRKRVGDTVTRGEVIAEVETDKGLIEVEVFTSGVIEQLLVEPGQKVPVGTVLAIIRSEAEGRASPGAAGPAPPVVPAATPSVPRAPPSRRARASPAARKLAQDLGVDPASLRGTGPDGAVTREDVAAAAAARATAPAPTVPGADRYARMRQTIAAAMARSKREIPHYYLSTTIDMTRTTSWLTDQNRERPITERLLYGVVLLKAVAVALRKVPELNGFWREGRAEQRDDINVGVAISLRHGGLVVPALHETDRQGLDALMRRFRDLVARARAGTLRSSELSEATITVTSLGEQGVEAVFGVIYPPQLAIVGFGKVVERPWVVEGQVAARPVVTATLAADHRATDGHRGGLFLSAVETLLQQPESLA